MKKMKTVLVLLVAATLVNTASAQEVVPTQGLVLEEMQSGFVVSPVVKFTGVDDDLGTLAGVSGGWMTDGRLLIGAGAYWLVGGADEFDMAYGGGVVEWFSSPGARVSASIGSLVGFGSATLDTVVDSRHQLDGFGRISLSRFGGRRFLPSTTLRFPEEFFVAEPQASLVLDVTDWFRVRLGAGYRLIGLADQFEDRLRGYTASIGVQLGPS